MESEDSPPDETPLILVSDTATSLNLPHSYGQRCAQRLKNDVSTERQVCNGIAPLRRLRCAPDQQKRLDDIANGAALRNYEKAWTGPSRGQALAKITCHRASIVRDQNLFLLWREFEQNRIFRASVAELLGVQDVNGELTRS